MGLNEVAELKIIVLSLKAEVEKISFVMPTWISLSDISFNIGKSRDTIRKYLINNFEPNKDFKKFGSKIYVSRDALFLIRTHYEK